MQTFHIVLTALMAFGTMQFIVSAICFPTIALVSTKVFDIGVIVLLNITFYAIAAYCISTNNFALYWANVMLNTVAGIWNAKRMLNKKNMTFYDLIP